MESKHDECHGILMTLEGETMTQSFVDVQIYLKTL